MKEKLHGVITLQISSKVVKANFTCKLETAPVFFDALPSLHSNSCLSAKEWADHIVMILQDKHDTVVVSQAASEHFIMRESTSTTSLSSQVYHLSINCHSLRTKTLTTVFFTSMAWALFHVMTLQHIKECSSSNTRECSLSYLLYVGHIKIMYVM